MCLLQSHPMLAATTVLYHTRCVVQLPGWLRLCWQQSLVCIGAQAACATTLMMHSNSNWKIMRQKVSFASGVVHPEYGLEASWRCLPRGLCSGCWALSQPSVSPQSMLGMVSASPQLMDSDNLSITAVACRKPHMEHLTQYTPVGYPSTSCH